MTVRSVTAEGASRKTPQCSGREASGPGCFRRGNLRTVRATSLWNALYSSLLLSSSTWRCGGSGTVCGSGCMADGWPKTCCSSAACPGSDAHCLSAVLAVMIEEDLLDQLAPAALGEYLLQHGRRPLMLMDQNWTRPQRVVAVHG